MALNAISDASDTSRRVHDSTWDPIVIDVPGQAPFLERDTMLLRRATTITKKAAQEKATSFSDAPSLQAGFLRVLGSPKAFGAGRLRQTNRTLS